MGDIADDVFDEGLRLSSDLRAVRRALKEDCTRQVCLVDKLIYNDDGLFECTGCGATSDQ